MFLKNERPYFVTMFFMIGFFFAVFCYVILDRYLEGEDMNPMNLWRTENGNSKIEKKYNKAEDSKKSKISVEERKKAYKKLVKDTINTSLINEKENNEKIPKEVLEKFEKLIIKQSKISVEMKELLNYYGYEHLVATFSETGEYVKKIFPVLLEIAELCWKNPKLIKAVKELVGKVNELEEKVNLVVILGFLKPKDKSIPKFLIDILDNKNLHDRLRAASAYSFSLKNLKDYKSWKRSMNYLGHDLTLKASLFKTLAANTSVEWKTLGVEGVTDVCTQILDSQSESDYLKRELIDSIVIPYKCKEEGQKILKKKFLNIIMHSNNSEIRQNAVQAFTHLKIAPDVMNVFKKVLREDDDPIVKGVIILTIPADNPETIELVLNEYYNSKNERYRGFIITKMDELVGKVKVINFLLDTILYGKKEGEKLSAISSLSIGSAKIITNHIEKLPEIRVALHKLLTAKGILLRHHAAIALSTYGNKTTVDILEKLIPKEKDTTVRDTFKATLKKLRE